MKRKALIPFLVMVACCMSFKFIFEPAYPFRKLKFFPKMPESFSNPVTIAGARLGRFLFYDPVLSADGKMSCSSCHKQAYAFSDSSKAFSTGAGGTLMKRNTMTLFNLAWYPSFFWDGRATSIENQIAHPLLSKDEMQINWDSSIGKIKINKQYLMLFKNAFPDKEIDSSAIVNALAQFLRTLLSNQSKYDRVIAGEDKFTTDELDGFVLVNDQTKGDCLHCHTTDANALGTTLTFSNNGLDTFSIAQNLSDKGRGAITGNPKDIGKFKIPSLRNVLLTAPYMHDGRFKTLEEVVNFYSEGIKPSATLDSKMEFAAHGGNHLSALEKRKVIAFLKTLTDSSFISNPEFSNPFIKE